MEWIDPRHHRTVGSSYSWTLEPIQAYDLWRLDRQCPASSASQAASGLSDGNNPPSSFADSMVMPTSSSTNPDCWSRSAQSGHGRVGSAVASRRWQRRVTLRVRGDESPI